MSYGSLPGYDDPPLTVARHVDEVCLRFEAAWKVGQRPRVEDYLGPVALAERAALLPELIALDVYHRGQAGETSRADDYRQRFPDADLADLFAEPSTGKNSWEGPERHATPPQPGSPPDGRGLRIRCPHCHNPLQLVDESPDGVLCPACGSSFRVCEARQTTTTDAMRPLGKFQLLERVGLGAFGAVWRARDTELDRLVALKIPHAGLLTSSDDLERFHREARAAAQLRHPGIVTVHEVQTLEGLPAIVEDFVEGIPLRDLLETRRLTFREAASLLAEVADALHYAHEKGLVHRDVKPANIMLEAVNGQAPSRSDSSSLITPYSPKVMDFGLALRDGAEITMTLDGHIIGTPAYMSPEQAAGKGHQADRRSDVYSLGVILYEALTGELPFRGSKMMILHQVVSEEPRPPCRLNDKIPRDLETICLKALAKEPGRRYATARALADDLRRFLAGEPILARPVGHAERLRRWCRRNPALAALSAALVLAVVGGLTGVLLKWREAEAQRKQATTAWALAEQRLVDVQTEQQRANEEAEITRGVLGFFEYKVIAAARPTAFQGLGHEVSLRRALESALPFVEQSFQNQPLVEARLRHTLGVSFSALGDVKTAAEQHQRAWTLYARHRGPEHADTLRSMYALAYLYSALGRHREALKLREEILAIWKVKLGPDHPDTLKSMEALGLSYAALGRRRAALQLRQEALARCQAVRGPDHADTLTSMGLLAKSYHGLGRHAEALKLREEVLATTKAKFGPDSIDTLLGMADLGDSYHAVERHGEALKLREETLALMKAKVGLDHGFTLYAMCAVAASLCALDRYPEAEPLIDDCLARAVAKVDDPDLIFNLLHLRLRQFAKTGNAAGCRATAERWEELHHTDPRSLCYSADMRAVTATVIRSTDQSVDAGNKADAELERAMDWLRQAVAAGLNDADYIAKDPDLAAVRDRPDFKKLIADLEARQANGHK